MLKASGPRISIVMPVYNAEKFLEQAITSILTQTLSNFEFIIIDDASTDSSSKIILKIREYDPRILILRNEHNMGTSVSLNKGIARARGEYIARMDADDISFPERLEMQTEFLDKHRDIGVLGTAAQIIDEDKKRGVVYHMPCEHHLIAWEMLFRCPFIHPSIMMRRSLVEQAGGYNEKISAAQDFDLWERLRFSTRFANLEEVYILLRKHRNSISNLQSDKQLSCTFYTLQKMMEEELKTSVSLKHVKQIRRFLSLPGKSSDNDAVVAARYIYQLYRSYTKRTSLSFEEKGAVHRSALQKMQAIHYHKSRWNLRLLPAVTYRSCLKLRR